MKRFLSLVILSLLLCARGAFADGPDDQYVVIYSLIQQADTLKDAGKGGLAMIKYLDAQTTLKKFQQAYPEWNANVVNYRLNYLAAKIAGLASVGAAATPATNGPVPASEIHLPPPEATNPPPATNAAASIVPPAASGADAQIAALQDQVRRLEADRSLLQAKLKEALAAQPAVLDPQELAKAEDQIKALQKENEVLKASLADAKTNSVPANSNALTDANQKISALTEANAALELDKTALLARVKTLSAPDEASLALRAENEILRKQVADLKGQGTASTQGGDSNRKLLEAQAQIAALQSDKEILRLEKTALESQSRRWAAANSAAPPGVKPAEVTGPDAETAVQLTALRARVEIYEAKAVPYTAEELALFKLPPATLVASAHASAAVSKSPPPGSEALLAEAKQFFVAGQFDKVEEKYLEVLKLDDKNVSTLTHLATVQLELNHFDDAEKNVKQALALAPNDAYGLETLGRLRFQQARYDEALDVLSRAAQISPENPEIQNYLGITLSHKGLRAPAETALRKAIQIDPKFAPAHNNLAVIYITQDPPFVELARWHYQQAIAAGHPHNPDLEKLLEKSSGEPAKP